MKKLSIIILSLLVLCLPLSAKKKAKSSDKKAKGPVTVEIWHTYGGSQAQCLNDLADAFNAKQSDYIIKVMNQDYSGFADYVYNAVANGIGPSVIFNYASTAVDYVKEDLALDISTFIKEDAKKGDNSLQEIIDSLPEMILSNDVYGFSADSPKTKTGVYYLPGCTTGPVFFYNKTMYDQYGLKAPTTWAELEANSKVIYENTGKAGFYSDGLVDNLQSMIMTSVGKYIDIKSKTVGFCTKETENNYQWYADNCKKGYFEFNTIGRYASEDLSNGDIAAFSGSCVNDQYIKMVNGDELGIAPMICSGNDSKFYTAWNRGPIFFKRNADVDRGTYEFIKFFLSPENNAKWAKANSALSPYNTTVATETYKDYINNLPETSALPAVQANLPYGGSFPSVVGASQIRNLMVEYLNNVVDGKLTAAEAIKKLESECNKALNQ